MFDEHTRILDLGSENGSNIHSVLRGTKIKPSNVYIADIDSNLIEQGRDMFGFVPVLIRESDRLPFPDGFFDIVYCSSVIEHVTIPKGQAWEMRDDFEFKRESMRRQMDFSADIRRVGRQYFVQTPSKSFPIESHSWLPFIGYMPRWALLPALRFTNLFWIKKTTPDWNLLNRDEMAALFDDAKIVQERFLGLTKSIMAIKSSVYPPRVDSTLISS